MEQASQTASTGRKVAQQKPATPQRIEMIMKPESGLTSPNMRHMTRALLRLCIIGLPGIAIGNGCDGYVFSAGVGRL